MAESGKRVVSFQVTDEIDKSILELKKTDRFIRSSYSEVARELLLKGIQKSKEEKK